MRIVILLSAVMLSTAIGHAKLSADKKNPSPEKNEKVIRQNYLTFCHQRVQKKHSLKNARTICQCALKAIIKNGSMNDLKILSRKSPKQLTENNESEKKRNQKLIALSDLEVHSLDDCERTLR